MNSLAAIRFLFGAPLLGFKDLRLGKASLRVLAGLVDASHMLQRAIYLALFRQLSFQFRLISLALLEIFFNVFLGVCLVIVRARGWALLGQSHSLFCFLCTFCDWLLIARAGAESVFEEKSKLLLLNRIANLISELFYLKANLLLTLLLGLKVLRPSLVETIFFLQ